jgi:hypothetical protein
MKGLENNTYLVLYIISNIVALIILLASWKHYRVSRMMLFILFAWASSTNLNEAIVAPQFYMDYSGLTFSNLYRNFIQGWFSRHILLSVGFIATCQAFIAISMLLSGGLFKIGAAGAIIFLVAIAPLGVGAAFPCTIILAIAIGLLVKQKQIDYIWVSHPTKGLTIPTKNS